MKGVGAAGVMGLAGVSSTAQAAEHEDEDGDMDEFAAVRVGNLVPDVATGDPVGPPGRGRGQNGSRGQNGDDPPGQNGDGPPGRGRDDPPGWRGPPAPDSTALDVYAGKQPDGNPTIARVSYPTFGPGPADSYLQVPAREYDVTTTWSGATDPLFEDTMSLSPGYRYTALAVGRASPENDDDEAFQAILIEDGSSREAVTPPEDSAEVSFVHASPNAGPVDVVVEGDSFADLTDVAFGDVTDYLGAQPGSYDVEIQADGETVLSVAAELVAGTRVTVYVAGLAGVDEFPDEEGRFGLSTVASVDGLNPLPNQVLTR